MREEAQGREKRFAKEAYFIDIVVDRVQATLACGRIASSS